VSRIYGAVLSISAGTGVAAAPMCDLESSAIESPAILAVDFNTTTANGPGPLGLGIASNTPVALAKIPFIQVDPKDPSCTSVMAIAWTTAPAVPANFFRMFSFRNLAASGQYQLFTFPRGLKVAPSSSFVVWDIEANAVAAPMVFNSTWEIEL
jgi:hypothetical protein